ncbi:MAG: hypothetical protein ACI8W8_003004 [Rhodothermales bacterium]|jgi:hypothetical protein
MTTTRNLCVLVGLLCALAVSAREYATIKPSRDGTTMETNGIITPLDQAMRNFYIRNNDGIIEVKLKEGVEVGLQARVQRTGAWESDALIPEFRRAEEMSIPIPETVYAKISFADLKTAERTLALNRDLYGGRVYLGPIGEHLPTATEPWLSGKVTVFHSSMVKTIEAGGKQYKISTKGHDNAEVVIGAMAVEDIRPFEQQAFVRGAMKDGVFYADEVTLRPLPLAKEDPSLGRYLFIGDSISGNYDRALRQALKGKLNLVHPPTNCGNSQKGLDNMGQWLGPYDQKGRGWDVISFNFGHWDSKSSKAVYQQNLESIITILRKTGAKLIFVTTTPIPLGYPAAPEPNAHKDGANKGPGRASGTMEKYINPWALEVMTRHPDIAICDQHSLIEAETFYEPWLKSAGNKDGKGSDYGDLHIPGLLSEPIGRQLARIALDVLGRDKEPLTTTAITDHDLAPGRQRASTKGMDVPDFRDLLSNDTRLRAFSKLGQ